MELPPILAAQALLLEPRAAVAFLQRVRAGQPQSAEPSFFDKYRKEMAPRSSVAGGLGVLEISGVLAYRPDIGEMLWEGMEDSAEVLAAFRRLDADPEAKAIVLNIHSPGGFSVGGAELADAVFNARKPVVAWTGGMMCSLAYWIGSQADAVIATRNAMIGSIGAYVTVVDYHRMLANAGIEVLVFRNQEGRFKAAGVPGTEVTEDQGAQFQKGAQRAFDVFRDDVTRSRPGVGAGAMQGQVFDGSEGRGAGLIDSVGDLSWAKSVALSMARAV